MIFSISIPVRGHARYLRNALESIRCQSSAVELAIMDATPDDSVQEVVRDYRVRIAYAYHRPDGGNC